MPLPPTFPLFGNIRSFPMVQTIDLQFAKPWGCKPYIPCCTFGWIRGGQHKPGCKMLLSAHGTALCVGTVLTRHGTSWVNGSAPSSLLSSSQCFIILNNPMVSTLCFFLNQRLRIPGVPAVICHFSKLLFVGVSLIKDELIRLLPG